MEKNVRVGEQFLMEADVPGKLSESTAVVSECKRLARKLIYKNAKSSSKLQIRAWCRNHGALVFRILSMSHRSLEVAKNQIMSQREKQKRYGCID